VNLFGAVSFDGLQWVVTPTQNFSPSVCFSTQGFRFAHIFVDPIAVFCSVTTVSAPYLSVPCHTIDADNITYFISHIQDRNLLFVHHCTYTHPTCTTCHFPMCYKVFFVPRIQLHSTAQRTSIVPSRCTCLYLLRLTGVRRTG
jgi:hypothetical protein